LGVKRTLRQAYSPDVCFTPESRHGFSESSEVQQFL
jgi:hypothetical protein